MSFTRDPEFKRLQEAFKRLQENGDNDYDSDDDVDETEGKSPSQEDMKVILQQIKDQDDLTDEDLHKTFERLGLNPHKAESEIYKELRKRL